MEKVTVLFDEQKQYQFHGAEIEVVCIFKNEGINLIQVFKKAIENISRNDNK